MRERQLTPMQQQLQSKMSSKKKNSIVACSNCSCSVLAKDLDVHREECSREDWSVKYNSKSFIPKTNIIIPRTGMIASNQNLANAKSFLPPDSMGWEKRNAVLMHPEAMSALCISARQPCLLANINSISNSSDSSQCVCVWPCDLVKETQIYVRGARIGAKFRVNIPNVIKVPLVQLRPSEGRHCQFFYSKKNFRFSNYLDSYLSNSYLATGVPVRVHYYGHEHTFDLILPDEEKYKVSDPSSIWSAAVVVKPASGCTFHIVDGLAASSSDSHRLTFFDFGGAENVKKKINEHVIEPLKYGGKEACSVILSGDTGCGKTLCLHIIQECLGGKALLMSGEEFAEFISEGIDTDGEKMAVLVDNFDDLTGHSEELCRMMDTYANFVFVLAVRNIEAIKLPLRRRFRYELQLPVPSLQERKEILLLLFRQRREDLASAVELINHVAQRTHGYTGSDLKAVSADALDLTFDNISELFERFDAALKGIRPTGIRQFVLEVPNVLWSDIGGNQELKSEIEQAIVWPYQYPDLFERFAAKPPSGILLYGPPGCSKTLIARAIASESRMNFLAVKGPELFNKWVGESERAVRELFRRARQVAPAIIFFDEIDSVAAVRGDINDSRVGERVLTQLLTELDGLEKKNDVLVLAATNRPDRLDSALLRPGRLDLLIHVPLPDEETRREIMHIRLLRMTAGYDVDLGDIAKQTEGFSGAEVVQLCERAARLAMLESKDANMLHLRHFLKALEKIVPRTDRKLLDIYEKFEKGAS